MRRRALLLAIVLGSLPATAQQAPAVARLGVLAAEDLPALDGLREGLRDLGYVEGANLRIDYRWGEGRDERYARAASELVALGVDVIVTWGTPPARAALAATSTIPIVMASTGDPVAAGLVENLARPGGNISGFTSQSSDLEPKRLQHLRELVPSASRLGVLWNPSNPTSAAVLPRVRTTAASLNMTVLDAGAATDADLAPAMTQLANSGAEAVLVLADMFLLGHREAIVAFMAERRLPSAYSYPEFVQAGGLLSYGTDYKDQLRRTARYVDRVLKGTPVGSLPVQQPSRFLLVINLRTARNLGIEVPPAILALADEVID
jgi:putative ABC transport system substrate-binding protein